MKLWGILRKKQKIARQHTSVLPASMSEFNEDALYEAMDDICRELDIARPVVIGRHVKDFNEFKRVVFRGSDFIEKVEFDTFELELIDDSEKKNKR